MLHPNSCRELGALTPIGAGRMRITGIYPLNINWVEENKHVLNLSTPYSTGGLNAELAVLSHDTGVDSYQVLKAINVANLILKADENRKILQTFCEDNHIPEDDMRGMLLRVAATKCKSSVMDDVCPKKNIAMMPTLYYYKEIIKYCRPIPPMPYRH